MLIIRPQGGLANRMRVIDSALRYANSIGVELACQWVVNSDCGACYGDLFTPICSVKMYDDCKISYKRTSNKCGIKRVRNKLWNSYHGADVFYNQEDYASLIKEVSDADIEYVHEQLTPLLRKGLNVCVETGSVFERISHVDIFKPIATIDAEVNRFASGFGQNTIGVHIRRTDNSWSIDNSPLSAFEDEMDTLISKNHDTRFYLATDDKETIDCLRSRFGERISVREKDFRRASVSGVQDALVDILILSKTAKILGSYYSSFSEMASWIGGVELCVI